MCTLPKPPAGRALSEGKEAPQAAFPSWCFPTQTKRRTEGIRVPVPLAWGGSSTARVLLRLCPESACQTGPSLELSCRLEAGGCAVRAERSKAWDFDRGIAGLHFLLTNAPSRVRRSEAALRAHLARYGATLDTDVTPAVDFLVVYDGDDGGETSIRARELGVPVLSEAEFNALVGMRFPDAETFLLPSWIDEIADAAFLNCQHLKKVVLHEGVTRIGNRSFAGCFRLTDVQLPAGACKPVLGRTE